MALQLEVVGSHGASMGANARRVLGEAELKIGREADNDWILPQNYVSRRQAVIRCVNGMYFLEQVGTCPIVINDGGRPLEKNRIARLSAGDRVFIDDIEIRVSEHDGMPSSSALPLGAFPTAAPAVSAVDALFPTPGGLPGETGPTIDPLEILGVPAGGASPRPAARPAAPRSALDDALSFATPRVSAPQHPRPSPGAADVRGADTTPPARPAPALPDDWMSPRKAAVPGAPVAPPPPRRPQPPEIPARAPAPAATMPTAAAHPAPAAAPRRPGGEGASIEDLLRGAGIDPGAEPISPEVAAQLGEVIRLVVEGTMQVLQARNEIRREFRLATTQIARKDNNPLKFSVDAADALHKLLVQRNPAYLDTVASFADAFDDIRLHQLAMLESLRDGFNHMLRQFDPTSLTEQFERTAPKAGRLSLGGRAKPWESYVLRYGELSEDKDFAFRKLFGEEFGKAYERNLERHRRMLRAKDRGEG